MNINIHKLQLIATIGTALVTSSCGRGIKFPGLETVSVGVMDRAFYFSCQVPKFSINQGLTVPIPGLSGSLMSLVPDLQSDRTLLQLSVPLETLITSTGAAIVQGGLPDGRALPDINSGILPRFGFDVGPVKLTVYMSPDSFGFFIPLNLPTPNGVELPTVLAADLIDERGNRLGKIYAVPRNVSGSGSGVFVLIPYLGGASRSLNAVIPSTPLTPSKGTSHDA